MDWRQVAPGMSSRCSLRPVLGAAERGPGGGSGRTRDGVCAAQPSAAVVPAPAAAGVGPEASERHSQRDGGSGAPGPERRRPAGSAGLRAEQRGCARDPARARAGLDSDLEPDRRLCLHPHARSPARWSWCRTAPTSSSGPATPAASRSSSTARPCRCSAPGGGSVRRNVSLDPERLREPRGRAEPGVPERLPRRAGRAPGSRMMRAAVARDGHGRAERDPAPPEPRRAGRRGHGRRRRADRRAVHDQYRHCRRRRDRPPGDGAGRRRLGDRADHRQHRRRRQGRAAHPRPPARARLRGAAGRRLPLPRPSVPDPPPGVRRGAREAAHQSRQRRLRREARRPVRDDDRGGAAPRQAGAHRGQLGQPGPGSLDPHDGRERPPGRSRSRPTRCCARRW